MQQLKFELVKLFARKRSFMGFAVLLGFQAIILILLQTDTAQSAVGWVLSRQGVSALPFYGGLTLGVAMIMFSFALLTALYLALIGGDIVAKEVEEGTMRLTLARPISRTRLIFIKWLACTIYTAVLMLFLAVTAIGSATLVTGKLGMLFVYMDYSNVFSLMSTEKGLWRVALAVAMLILTTQTASNLALMFSCMPVRPAAATALALSVLYVDQAVQAALYFHAYREYFISHHMICWVRVFHQPLPVWELAESLVVLLGLNIAFVVIGVLVFNARDLKS